MHGKHEHEKKKRDHHVLGHALQASLQLEAENAESKHRHDREIRNIDRCVLYHGNKAEACIVAGQKLHKVIDHPTADNCIKGH